jgi:hypothetical protein
MCGEVETSHQRPMLGGTIAILKCLDEEQDKDKDNQQQKDMVLPDISLSFFHNSEDSDTAATTTSTSTTTAATFCSFSSLFSACGFIHDMTEMELSACHIVI